MPLAWVAGIGSVLGGASSIFGANDQNRQAREQADRQNKYNKDVYYYQLEEQKRQYDYAVEGLEITKRNTERDLQFQEANRIQQYNYGMGIRAYEYQQASRIYDKSVANALKQQSFAELAEKSALVDQDRLLHEQLLSISFDETQTLFDYGAAAAGVGLQKRKAKTAAATEAQATRIAALKATGAAAARGVSGRSAAMNVQGLLAEAGARQAAIIDELMFNTEANEFQLFKMSQQLLLDKAGFETSRESAQLSDTATRNKIKLQALQAAIQAEASIALKPEMAPPLPKPFALPRPEYQEVFKPGIPPPPAEAVAAQTNLFTAGLGGMISGAQMGLSIANSFGSFNSFSGGGTNPTNFATNYSGPTSYSAGAATGAFNQSTAGLGSYSFGNSGFSPNMTFRYQR